MEKKTKLAIFDFDGTLINTPLPDEGKNLYQEKTGKKWPHKGWWSKPESLDLDVFEMPTVDEVIVDYILEAASKDTIIVMLTGRMQNLSDEVKKILDAHGLVFHEYHFNKGGSTEYAKMKTMDELLKKYPEVKQIKMWDDRDEHIPVFKEWGEEKVSSGRLDKFKIKHVVQNRH